jgi:glycosyltransferase involved in cell wall biosynthesis
MNESKSQTVRPTNQTVFHVMGGLRPSGMERMFQSSAGLWEQNGWFPIIVGQGQDHPFAHELIKAGYTINYVRNLRTISGLVDLSKLLWHLKPAVVHIHTESMHGPLAILTRLILPRKKIIQTTHSIFEFSGWVKRKRVFQNRMSKLAGVSNVSVSNAVAAYEMQSYSSNSIVIENWISKNFFKDSNESTKFAIDQIVIALVGNCSEIKNHEGLLRAVKNNPKFLVIHIGDDSDATEDERRLITELDLSKQILNLGVRSEIDQLLRKCHLFAMPSLIEGFGLALAEAMAIGLPCLISGARGLSWAENQPGVIVVKEGLTWDLVLDQINDFEIQNLSEKARQSRNDYKNRFSPDRGVREYVQVYSS